MRCCIPIYNHGTTTTATTTTAMPCRICTFHRIIKVSRKWCVVNSMRTRNVSSGACLPIWAPATQHTHQLPPKQEGRQSESEKKMCETKRKYFNCYEFRRFSHWTFGIVLSPPTFHNFLLEFVYLVPSVYMCSTSSLSRRCCYRQCRDKLMFYRYFILLRIHIVMVENGSTSCTFTTSSVPQHQSYYCIVEAQYVIYGTFFTRHGNGQQPTQTLKVADAAKVREGISNGYNCHRRLNLWFLLQRKVHWSKGTADWGTRAPVQLHTLLTK